MTSVRGGNDSLKVKLNAEEAALLRQVVDEITEVIAADEASPVHERLFPDAFEDPEETKKYNTMVRDELKTHKLSALNSMRNSDEDMGREPDPADPDGLALMVLHWLGWLQETMVENLDPFSERTDT